MPSIFTIPQPKTKYNPVLLKSEECIPRPTCLPVDVPCLKNWCKEHGATDYLSCEQKKKKMCKE